MLTFWSGSGSGGKTTLAQNTGTALARRGVKTLIIDLDPQNSGLTKRLGLGDYMSKPDYDISPVLIPDIRSQMGAVDRTLDDLIISNESVEGMDFDLIPAHSSLRELGEWAGAHYKGNNANMLHAAIGDSGIHNDYEVIIVDVRGSPDLTVRVGICGTRNVVVPAQLNPKGTDSVAGVEGDLMDWENQLNRDGVDASLNISFIVPNKVENYHQGMVKHRRARNRLSDSGHAVTPFEFHDLNIYDESWDWRMNVFEYAESSLTPQIGDHEKRIYGKFDALARIIQHGSPSDTEPVPYEDLDIIDHEAVAGSNDEGDDTDRRDRDREVLA